MATIWRYDTMALSAIYRLIYDYLFNHLDEHNFFLKPITFSIWSSLFTLWYVKLATVLFFYLIFFHAWIGVLHITEDYIKVVWLKKIINSSLFLTMVSQMIYLTHFLVMHSYD